MTNHTASIEWAELTLTERVWHVATLATLWALPAAAIALSFLGIIH
jgi:hypothetical protein